MEGLLRLEPDAGAAHQNFITKDKVDLVFGPFSTLLSAPSASVAHRYGYAFIEPAGGGPAIFQEKLNNVFFTQPAPVVQSGDVFANFLLNGQAFACVAYL